MDTNLEFSFECSTANSHVSSSKLRHIDAQVLTSVAVNNPCKARPATQKLKKPPQAPRRFKSSFIFFSVQKHKEIKAELEAGGEAVKTIHVAKIVSQAWKSLSAEEREKWDKLAEDDKTRYDVEKSQYKGPWKVAVGKRRLKDPTSPKRPMSAFLAFSNKRRGMVKRKNPHMGNGELSKALSVMWKEAPNELRQKYIQDELVKREAYKVAMAAWKKAKRDERQSCYHHEMQDTAHFDTDQMQIESRSLDDHHRALDAKEQSVALMMKANSKMGGYDALTSSARVLNPSMSFIPGDLYPGITADGSSKRSSMNLVGWTGSDLVSLLHPSHAQESTASSHSPCQYNGSRVVAFPQIGGSSVLDTMMRQRLQSDGALLFHQQQKQQRLLLARLHGMDMGGGGALTALHVMRGGFAVRDDVPRFPPFTFPRF